MVPDYGEPQDFIMPSLKFIYAFRLFLARDSGIHAPDQ